MSLAIGPIIGLTRWVSSSTPAEEEPVAILPEPLPLPKWTIKVEAGYASPLSEAPLNNEPYGFNLKIGAERNGETLVFNPQASLWNNQSYLDLPWGLKFRNGTLKIFPLNLTYSGNSRPLEASQREKERLLGGFAESGLELNLGNKDFSTITKLSYSLGFFVTDSEFYQDRMAGYLGSKGELTQTIGFEVKNLELELKGIVGLEGRDEIPRKPNNLSEVWEMLRLGLSDIDYGVFTGGGIEIRKGPFSLNGEAVYFQEAGTAYKTRLGIKLFDDWLRINLGQARKNPYNPIDETSAGIKYGDGILLFELIWRYLSTPNGGPNAHQGIFGVGWKS